MELSGWLGQGAWARWRAQGGRVVPGSSLEGCGRVARGSSASPGAGRCRQGAAGLCQGGTGLGHGTERGSSLGTGSTLGTGSALGRSRARPTVPALSQGLPVSGQGRDGGSAPRRGLRAAGCNPQPAEGGREEPLSPGQRPGTDRDRLQAVPAPKGHGLAQSGRPQPPAGASMASGQGGRCPHGL